MQGWSIDSLHAVAKSHRHFAVLLVRKFFTREEQRNKSVNGGRDKEALHKILMERV